MSQFAPALAVTIYQECGDDPTGAYTCDPRDPGGDTRWGISQRSYPLLDIEHLTKAAAEALYFRDYWTDTGYWQIEAQDIATKVFDMGVNCGPESANRILQQALGTTVDGDFGPDTLAAVNAAVPYKLLPLLRLLEATHYRAIVERSPQDEIFLEDWLLRAASV